MRRFRLFGYADVIAGVLTLALAVYLASLLNWHSTVASGAQWVRITRAEVSLGRYTSGYVVRGETLSGEAGQFLPAPTSRVLREGDWVCATMRKVFLRVGPEFRAVDDAACPEMHEPGGTRPAQS
jgi:hypothetical protein